MCSRQQTSYCFKVTTSEYFCLAKIHMQRACVVNKRIMWGKQRLFCQVIKSHNFWTVAAPFTLGWWPKLQKWRGMILIMVWYIGPARPCSSHKAGKNASKPKNPAKFWHRGTCPYDKVEKKYWWRERANVFTNLSSVRPLRRQKLGKRG